MGITTGIETRAMKFKLQRGAVRRSTRDKDAEKMLKDMNGDEGQLVSRKLFLGPTSPVQKYQQKSSEMYQYHTANTLPYGDDGTRLMSNSIYFEYTGRMTQFIAELEALKQTIVGDESMYHSVVQHDITRRNAALTAQNKPPTATAADYMGYEAMRDRLYVTWFPEPVATSGDFRFEISADMKKVYDDNLARIVEDAKADVLNRVLEPMKAFVKRMSVPIGEEGAVFRDTMVTNLTDLVTHLPKLNIDDDPRISSMVAELRTITAKFTNPDVLRSNSVARATAKKDVSELMNKLTGGWKI